MERIQHFFWINHGFFVWKTMMKRGTKKNETPTHLENSLFFRLSGYVSIYFGAVVQIGRKSRTFSCCMYAVELSWIVWLHVLEVSTSGHFPTTWCFCHIYLALLSIYAGKHDAIYRSHRCLYSAEIRRQERLLHSVKLCGILDCHDQVMARWHRFQTRPSGSDLLKWCWNGYGLINND